jgi:hypothetical protein
MTGNHIVMMINVEFILKKINENPLMDHVVLVKHVVNSTMIVFANT